MHKQNFKAAGMHDTFSLTHKCNIGVNVFSATQRRDSKLSFSKERFGKMLVICCFY